MNDVQAWLNRTMHEEREENSSWDVMAEIADKREVLASLDVEPVASAYREQEEKKS